MNDTEPPRRIDQLFGRVIDFVPSFSQGVLLRLGEAVLAVEPQLKDVFST